METFPDWASWSYDKEHLPQEFHSKGGVDLVLKAIPLVDTQTELYGEVEYLTLVIGLALRDIVSLLDHNDDRPLPAWVSCSPLGTRHKTAFLKLCDLIGKGSQGITRSM